MDEMDKDYKDLGDERDDYLLLQKRSKMVRHTISILVSLLILTVSIFAALFVGARKETPPDNIGSGAESEIESSGEVSDGLSETSESGVESEVSEPPLTSAPETSEDVSVPVLYGVTIDSIYVYGDVGLQYFASSALAESKFADALGAYRAAFSSSVRMYSILVPTYAEFYEFEDKRTVGQSQTDSIARINAKLKAGIKALDIIPTLREHSEEYLYYRTDVNWSPLAAYYAYEKFMEEIGAEPVALKDYELGTIDEFVGSSYVRTQAKQLLDSPDYIDFYRTDLKFPSNVTRYFHDGTIWTNSQLVFKNVSGLTNGYQIFGAETRYIRAITKEKTGKKLLVLRENSAAAFLPFLLPHFDEIHAVDTRYFAKHTGESITDFVKDLGITDVLFMYYTTSANNGTRINELQSLLSARQTN